MAVLVDSYVKIRVREIYEREPQLLFEEWKDRSEGHHFELSGSDIRIDSSQVQDRSDVPLLLIPRSVV